MIVDPGVFDDEHVPWELPHRHTELEKLDRALDPGYYGADVDDVLIAGPSGVGKTALARHYLQRAVEHEDLQWGYVQCLGETDGDILRETLRELTNGNADVRHNTPIEDVRRRLAGLEERSVVILDEADDLPETDVLDHFAGLHRISLIVICHDRERWTSRLSDQHQTRFRSVIQPDRYSVAELTDILRPRAKQGLEPNAVGIRELEEIADESAGVARRGIQALRAAAELATERGHGQIQDDDVADCFDRARTRIRESNLASLPYHHQVLYALIREAGEDGVRARELNERYEARGEALYRESAVTPISKRARRSKLAKLIEYDLIESEDVEGGRQYRVVEVGLASPVELPAVWGSEV